MSAEILQHAKSVHLQHLNRVCLRKTTIPEIIASAEKLTDCDTIICYIWKNGPIFHLEHSDYTPSPADEQVLKCEFPDIGFAGFAYRFIQSHGPFKSSAAILAFEIPFMGMIDHVPLAIHLNELDTLIADAKMTDAIFESKILSYKQ
jgi:hypothetical protein